jgi:2-polyprenyl-3-methyl-5-hydroxy-6-metoxy-1,4-benzoquinol methylase
MLCLICGSDKNKTVFNEEGIDVKKCLDCGHIFSTYVQVDFYNGYYPDNLDSINHGWWQGAHQLMYRKFWNRLMKKNSGSLLDVGCGLGYFLKEISELDKNKKWLLFGAETSVSAFNFANNNLGLNNIFLGPVENAPYQEKYFDVVTLWDLLEHLENPRRSLKKINDILKDNGNLFISTPNINIQLFKARLKKFLNIGTDHGLEVRDHLHNYSPRSLSRLLKESGFNTIEFVQLPPIQAVSGSSNKILVVVKNIWFYFSYLFFYLSFHRLNFNNLYVIASKN